MITLRLYALRRRDRLLGHLLGHRLLARDARSDRLGIEHLGHAAAARGLPDAGQPRPR